MRLETRLTPLSLVLGLVTVGGIFVALFFGSAIAKGDYMTLGAIGVFSIMTAWAVGGRKIWWLPLLFFACLGGHFYIGFKIYTHELAVGICLLPLALALAMNRDQFQRRNLPIIRTVLILFAYLIVHFGVCLMNNKLEGVGGMGNVVRRYMDALWPFLIFIPFLFVGRTNRLPWALHLMTLAILARFSLGLVTTLRGDDAILYIPGINYIPAGGLGWGDLRVSGFMLTAVMVCYFCMTRSFLLRCLLTMMILIAIWGTFLGGGRITVVTLFLLFAFVFVVYRKYQLIGFAGGMAVIAIMLLNANPQVLHELPTTISRAGTAFLFDRELAADTASTRSSDEWHSRLMREGYLSWTSNPFTFLFGRGVGAFEEGAWSNSMGQQQFEGMIEMAIKTSRFEKGLWDVLCTFGLVGMILYGMLIWAIIRSGWGIVRRERIKSPYHAMLFLGVYFNAAWIITCWIAGSFPSFQIMLGLLALVAAHDLKQQRQKATASAHSPLTTLPSASAQAQPSL